MESIIQSKFPWFSVRVLTITLVVVVLGLGIWWFLDYRMTWPRGDALLHALQPLVDEKGSDKSPVARAIRDNYVETRTNASRWSGVFWGLSFAAATLSALAGLILKLETFKNESVKKDIAAVFAVSAALLITISTSGDFQRKWQANRIAAAELEQIGYELLEKEGTDARSYMVTVGQILHRRHLSIVGQRELSAEAPKGAPEAE